MNENTIMEVEVNFFQQITVKENRMPLFPKWKSKFPFYILSKVLERHGRKGVPRKQLFDEIDMDADKLNETIDKSIETRAVIVLEDGNIASNFDLKLSPFELKRLLDDMHNPNKTR